jgi:hypothetical protein
MWALENKTSYAAERNWVRNKDGAHQWVVAVKATFDIALNGSLKLADEQKPPALAPEYWGEPGQSSLRYDSDLLYVKPGTDVILNGHAHALKGRPVPMVPVSLRVGELKKILKVHGDRFYKRGVFGLATTSPKPFVSRSINYEWAFGGADFANPDVRKQRMDLRNPIGKGFAVNLKEDQPAHAIEYLEGDPAKKGPAGYGAIDSFWSPRLEYAGTYDEKWERNRKPLLADDFDERFALCSPADQRLARSLRGGEQVELVNLTPEGVLRFELPKIYLAFTTHIRGRREEHRSILASVIIEPEEKRLSMVWQTNLPVSSRDGDYLDFTVIQEKQYLK